MDKLNSQTIRIDLLNVDGFVEVLKLYYDSAAHSGINSTIISIKEKYL